MSRIVHLRERSDATHAWSVLDPDDPVTLQSITDLGRAQPTDETLRNLLRTLNTKLDLCARLPFLAYEADREGFGDAAAAFRALGVSERQALAKLLTSLRLHLDRTEGHLNGDSQEAPLNREPSL